MKRILAAMIVSGIVVLGVGAAHAGAKLGVKGGVNLGDVSGDDVEADMRTGFSGGAFFGWGINDQFGVQVEGLYVMKGAEGKIDVGDGHEHDATFKIDYVEFPVLFNARFASGETVAFVLFAGPTFGFNVKSEAEVEGHGTADFGDVTKSFEFGGAVGAGIEYMLQSMSLFADARYTIGATEIFDEDDAGTKNRGIGIMAGVAFPIGSGN